MSASSFVTGRLTSRAASRGASRRAGESYYCKNVDGCHVGSSHDNSHFV
jgi:hypothetical protein